MIAVKIVDTKQDSFVHGTYNGIEIITRKSDGYVNASKNGSSFERNRRHTF